MGKTKPKRHRAKAPAPTGMLPSSGPDDMEESVEPVSGAVSGLVEKLQSSSASERECACSTIAAIMAQRNAIPQLIQANAVKVLGPLMLDPSEDVRQNAVGALRNMSVDGTSETCKAMVKQDIMTPLVALLQTYEVNWTPESKSEARLEMEPKVAVFLQGVHLLWNLCESSDVAFSIFNQQNLLPVLFPCLKVQVYGHQVALATAQCLYTVTENNESAASKLTSGECLSVLQEIITTQHNTATELLFKTLATGILYNISVCGNLESGTADILNSIVQMLGEILQQDVTTALTSTAQRLAQITAAEKENGAEAPEIQDLEVKHREIDGQIKEMLHLISSQQIALEMVANMCFPEDEDDGEGWEDLDSNSSSGEEMMEAEGCDEAAGGDSACVNPALISSEIHTTFVKHSIVERVFHKVEMPDSQLLAVYESNKEGKKVCKGLKDLHSRALLCVNNLVGALELEALGGTSHLHKLWLALGKLAVAQSGVNDAELLEAVTSAMRATVQKLGEAKALQLSEVSLEDMQFIFSLGEQTSIAEVQANAIRIVATIGCAQVNNNGSHQQIVKAIGEFLLSVCVKDIELWVIAEALDAIFDVFGPDDTDPIAKELAMVEKLKSMAQPLKTKIHQQRKNLGDHLPILSTARSNLVRFIKYKSQRLGT